MGLLVRATLAALAASTTACYSPDVRDCTVSCTGRDDCASEQVCGSDHLCAAPAIAGQCSSQGSSSSVPADAATHGVLTITIAGHGSITAGGLGSCAYTSQPCELRVPLDAGEIAVEASGGDGWSFVAWTAGSCAGRTDTSCTFPPSVALVAGASFSKDEK